MAHIITEAQTVGEIIEQCAERLLDGLLRPLPEHVKTAQKNRDQNAAARRAVELFKEDLLEVWCPDADTLLKEVKVPQR